MPQVSWGWWYLALDLIKEGQVFEELPLGNEGHPCWRGRCEVLTQRLSCGGESGHEAALISPSSGRVGGHRGPSEAGGTRHMPCGFRDHCSCGLSDRKGPRYRPLSFAALTPLGAAKSRR